MSIIYQSLNIAILDKRICDNVSEINYQNAFCSSKA